MEECINCNWFRMPVYDVYGNMVGWSGEMGSEELLAEFE